MKLTNKKSSQAWVRTTFMAIAIVFSSYCFAQPPGGGQGGQGGPPPIPDQDQVEAMVEDLSEELSLTSEQESEVLDLYTAHFDEARDKTSGNNKPERSEMEALRASFENDLKKVLSDEQYEDFQDYSKKQKQKRH